MDSCPRPAVRRGRCEVHAPPPWAGSAERRARLLPPPREWRRLKKRVRSRARGRCESCGAKLERSGVVDHRVPLVLSRDSSLSNLWLLCAKCDDEKTRADLAFIRKRALRPDSGQDTAGTRSEVVVSVERSLPSKTDDSTSSETRSGTNSKASTAGERPLEAGGQTRRTLSPRERVRLSERES